MYIIVKLFSYEIIKHIYIFYKLFYNYFIATSKASSILYTEKYQFFLKKFFNEPKIFV